MPEQVIPVQARGVAAQPFAAVDRRLDPHHHGFGLGEGGGRDPEQASERAEQGSEGAEHGASDALRKRELQVG